MTRRWFFSLPALIYLALCAAPWGWTQQSVNPDLDEIAIRKNADLFVAAFEKGDAKTIAAFWTENGEYQEESGVLLRGRAEIEKAYAGLFKEHPKGKMTIRIESIHFPAKDLAIEAGLIRQTQGPRDLPTSARYSVIHIREDGQWKIALAREFGSGRDRLDDLEWLLGSWQAAAKDQEMNLSFARDQKKPFIVGKVSVKAKGKVVSAGSIKIGVDPQRGQLRSWHFEDDGGHGQALWIRDGNRWVLDAIGVLADGRETAAVNIITRVGPQEIGWHSIDRTIGNQALPNTLPVKLTRVTP